MLNLQGKTVAFFVSEGELQQRGWTAESLTEERVRVLLKGLCSGRAERVETYRSAAGVLLVVRQSVSRPTASRPPRRGRLYRL